MADPFPLTRAALAAYDEHSTAGRHFRGPRRRRLGAEVDRLKAQVAEASAIETAAYKRPETRGARGCSVPGSYSGG